MRIGLGLDVSSWRRGSGAAGPTTLVSDTFTRAGDTFTLGIADTGQVWAAFGGSDRYTITANQANPFQAISTAAGQVINAGTANATVQFTQVNAPAGAPAGVVFRWVDALNYWLWWGSSATGMRLSKFVAGVETVLFTDAVTAPGASTVYAVTVDAANLITCKRNGVTIRSTTDATHSTGTRYGFGGGAGTSDLFDNFTVVTP